MNQNDEHNVEEFLKALSCLSRKYGLILGAGIEDCLYVVEMHESERHPAMSYIKGQWGIEWEKVSNV